MQQNKVRNSFSIDAILSDQQHRNSYKREVIASPLPVDDSSARNGDGGIPAKRPSPPPPSNLLSSDKNSVIETTDSDSLHHLRQLAARSIFHSLVLQQKQQLQQQVKVGRSTVPTTVTGGADISLGLPTETRRQGLRDVTSSLSPALPTALSPAVGDGRQQQQQQHQTLLQKMYESRLSAAAAAAALADGAWRYGLGTTASTGFPIFPSSLPCVCGMASCRQTGHDGAATRTLLSPASASVCDVSSGRYSTLSSGAKSDLCVPIPIPMYLRTRTGHVVSGSVRMRKCRRSRTVFSELQLMGLEKRFDTQKYLSTPDRADLGKQLGLSQLQVKTWYQNRRMKWKRQILQNGGTEPPTRPKGRPKKLDDASHDSVDRQDDDVDDDVDNDVTVLSPRANSDYCANEENSDECSSD